jgi:membrane protein required for colicin V production
MNALDWVLGCTGILCVCRGLWRGAVSQIFGIAGVLGGFLTAAYFYQDMALRISQSFASLKATPLISFIALFFLSWFCIVILGTIFSKVLQRSGLGLMDRTVGAFLGIGKALLVAVVLISFMTFFLPPQNDLLSRSYSVPYVQRLSTVLITITPQSLQQLFDRKRIELDNYLAGYEKARPGIAADAKNGAKIRQ